MSVARLVPLGLLAAMAVACARWAAPPTKEIDQAREAIEAARAAGADEYARDDAAAAADALKHAQDAVADHDYRLALSSALDGRERAQTAATLAAERKAAARAGAEKAVSALADAIATAKARVKSAERVRVPAKTLSAPRRGVADAERHLQEARAALEKGHYEAADTNAAGATAQLANVTRDLRAPRITATRRRR